jgi:hypothetical protein
MTRWSTEAEDEFRADWAAGLTLAELAAKYGVSMSTISNYSIRFDCPSRTPGRRQGSGVVDNSPSVLKNGEWVSDANGVKRWQASA